MAPFKHRRSRQNPQKHIAILVAFGPEVRAFIHSGFAQTLAKRWKVTVFSSMPHSRALTGLENIRILPLPEAKERSSLRRLRYWAMQANSVWLNSQGRSRWRHYMAENRPRKRSLVKRGVYFLVGTRMGSALVSKIERLSARLFGSQPEWKHILETDGIDCILTSSFGDERILPALQTAANLDIASVVLMNSWKDVYSHPYMPVVPSLVGVWSEKIARDLYLANPHLPAQRVIVLPSLHLEKFLAPDELMPKEQFYAAMELDISRPYICYTAASPKAVRSEELIVEHLLQAISAGRLPGNPQLLLRLNPMEDGTRFRDLTSRYTDLVIQKPDWEWDSSRDWCCALKQDIDSWVATVFYSLANISIPSTVTLEFLALNRPVINICFDAIEGLAPGESTIRFWNADFYSEIKEHLLVKPAFSLDELVTEVARTSIEFLHPQAEMLSASFKHATPVRSALGAIEELLRE